MSQPYDIAVIGFGPTGASLATLLAQRRMRVVVFDKYHEVYPKPRAIGMDHEVMRIFQRIGISDTVEATSILYPPTVYLGVDGSPIQKIELTPPPPPLSWPPTSTFDQPTLESALRAKVAGESLIDVFLDHDVVYCDENEVGITLRAVDRDGKSRTITAAYAVACDGAQSDARRRAGVKVENLGFEEDWLVIDVIVPDGLIATLPSTNVQYCDPRRPCTFVVCPGNHRRWEFKVLPGESFSGDIPPAKLKDLLSPWLPPDKAQIWRAAAYRFKAVLAERWRAGRLFFAGDAAHQMPPFLGQGMCQGIRDAANLEWKFARVFAGQSPEALLDSYQAERRLNVSSIIESVKRLGIIIGELDIAEARKRDVIMLAEQGGSIKPKLRQAFIPGLSSGPLLHPSPASGDVFPQPMIKHSCATVRLDDVIGASSLLMLRRQPDGNDAGNLAAICRDDDIVLAALDGGSNDHAMVKVEETQTILADWFTRHGCAAALVRPDHYVFGTTSDAGSIPALLSAYRSALTSGGSRP